MAYYPLEEAEQHITLPDTSKENGISAMIQYVTGKKEFEVQSQAANAKKNPAVLEDYKRQYVEKKWRETFSVPENTPKVGTRQFIQKDDNGRTYIQNPDDGTKVYQDAVPANAWNTIIESYSKDETKIQSSNQQKIDDLYREAYYTGGGQITPEAEQSISQRATDEYGIDLSQQSPTELQTPQGYDPSFKPTDVQLGLADPNTAVGDFENTGQLDTGGQDGQAFVADDLSGGLAGGSTGGSTGDTGGGQTAYTDKIEPFPKTTTEADSTVAGAEQTTKSIDDYVNLLTPPETEKDTQLDQLIDQYKGTLKETEGKEAYQLQQEEEFKVQQKRDALIAANNQINQKMAEYQALQLEEQNLKMQQEDRTVTMGTIIGSQAAVDRQYMYKKNSLAAEIGILQAQASGLQGSLQEAQRQADRAVDLKYADIETRLRNQATLIDLLRDDMSKDEQIRADAIQLYLRDQQQAVADQKQMERDKNNVMLYAAKNGYSQDALADIHNSSSVAEAYQKLAWYAEKSASTGIETPETRTIGGNLYEFNPSNGEWELTIEATTPEKEVEDVRNKPISLNESVTWGVPPNTTKGELEDMVDSGQVQIPSRYREDSDILKTSKGEVINKKYYRVEGTNEVYESSTGTHMTAEEFAKRGSPWPDVQVVNQAPTAEAIASAKTGAEKDGAYKTGTVKTFTEGSSIVTKEYQADGSWKVLSSAPRWKAGGGAGDKPKTVSWSQWAAELGVVGMTWDEAQPIIAQAGLEEKAKEQQEVEQIKDREIANTRDIISGWIGDKDRNGNREDLINRIYAQSDNLSKDEIAVEVYGLTKQYEGKRGYSF